jgi:hypothetical protein
MECGEVGGNEFVWGIGEGNGEGCEVPRGEVGGEALGVLGIEEGIGGNLSGLGIYLANQKKKKKSHSLSLQEFT